MNNIRKFISGRYEGTRLEIMASKPATHLADGTEIKIAPQSMLNDAQIEHLRGNIDVHAPQQFHFHDMPTGLFHQHTGPSVAQEWKILARGERPFYRYDGTVQR
jgi:hypothetical protein